MKYNEIEDIYPLTIISPRYNDNLVIFNLSSDHEIINNVELDEEIAYRLDEYLEENMYAPFGIGITLNDAFLDFKRRLLIKESN
jgi:hypothetical protein